MAPAVRGIVKAGVLILGQFYRINEAERSAPPLRSSKQFSPSRLITTPMKVGTWQQPTPKGALLGLDDIFIV